MMMRGCVILFLVLGLWQWPALAEDLQATQAASTAQSPEQLLTPEQISQAQFGLGMQLMQEKRFAGAAQAFTRAIESRPNFVDAHINLGVAHAQWAKQMFSAPQQIEQYQLAVEQFSKAAELQPDNLLTRTLWSETLVLIGDLPVEPSVRLGCYRGAVEQCRKLTEIDPDGWEGYNKWAVILSTKLPDFAVSTEARQRLFLEAADLLAKAAERARASGDLGPVYANWGGVLVRAFRETSDSGRKQSLLRDALAKFERSATIYPSAASTYAMWGSALVELGKMSYARTDFRDAIEKLNISLSLNPNDPATLYNLACAYALSDNPTLAVQNLQKCFEADRNKTFVRAAATDKDLASLRGDRTFDELVGTVRESGPLRYNPPLRDAPR